MLQSLSDSNSFLGVYTLLLNGLKSTELVGLRARVRPDRRAVSLLVIFREDQTDKSRARLKNLR